MGVANNRFWCQQCIISYEGVNDEMGSGRRRIQRLIARYSRWWGSENRYKVIKDFLA